MSKFVLPQSTPNSGDSKNSGKLATYGAGDKPKYAKRNNGSQEDIPRTLKYLPWSSLQSCLALSVLSDNLNARFGYLGHLEDIRNAIRCRWLAMCLAPDIDVIKAHLLNMLGILYITRFGRLDTLEDVNKAIECHSRALYLAGDHEIKSAVTTNLGTSYMRRFERNGDVADADSGIAYHAQGLQLTPEGHADRAAKLCALGGAYACLFMRRSDVETADKGISCLMQAVRLTPDGHAEKPGQLSNLGSLFGTRFRYYGEVADVNEAISCHVLAVQLTPDGHADKPSLLSNLGSSYIGRFQSSGNVSDVDHAITCLTQAMQLTPDGHAQKPEQLNNLGSAYKDKFRLHGSVLDIDNAIENHLKAVRLTPAGHAARPGRLNDLGNALISRFESHGDVADVHNAIAYQVPAVQLTPDGHADKPGRLNNLGSSYLALFKHREDLKDADNAIEYHLQALLLTPDGHVSKRDWANNLGNSYVERFKHSRSVADIDNGIKYLTRGVQLTPDGHANKPGLFSNLARAYTCRFEYHGDVTDISNGVNYFTQAVLITPNGHADKPGRLGGLGLSHLTRFEHKAQLYDLEAAIAFFKQAAQSVTGASFQRYLASRQWASASSLLGVSPQLAYQRAIDLVPQLVWLGTPIKQRYRYLADVGDVVTEAASRAIMLKEYDCALEWLEQGRSVVWNQILQLRTPFDELCAINPMFAERLKEIAVELEHAGSRRTATSLPTNDASDIERDAQHHRRLAIEWNQLLERVRCEVPGFRDFMLPRKAPELMRAAKDGPLIVINIDRIRCDAIIIQPHCEKLALVPLENFSEEKAINLRVQLVSWIGNRAGKDRGFKRTIPVDNHCQFKAILGTLWSDITKPILDFLGYTHRLPVDSRPHVTWCTTGPLSFLPLHAAGCYDGSQPNAPDLVVSSYTPTLSALLASTSCTPVQHSGILGVGQQYTKGHSDLPYTVQELAAIEEYARGVDYSQLDGESATVNAVLNAMEEHSWVHFACHASQHKDDPTRSSFCLCDGNLKLSTITQRSFKNKGLAFLSACQTATGDERLPDEAVHLAAGMMMAGYPSVIATMWSIHDEDAPQVARQVYAELLRDGEMDHTRAARGLHKAVAGLREKVGEGSFERWLPFIHIGS